MDFCDTFGVSHSLPGDIMMTSSQIDIAMVIKKYCGSCIRIDIQAADTPSW